MNLNDWWSEASCAEIDPELFYPNSFSTIEGTMQTAAALSICRACPVAAFCLRDAMQAEGSAGPTTRYGIRGGLTPAGRARLYASTRPKERVYGEPGEGCGTSAGYQRHRKTKTLTCKPCAEAESYRQRKNKGRLGPVAA